MRLIGLYARFIVSIVNYFLQQTPARRRQFFIAFILLAILFFSPVFYVWVDFRSVNKLKNYTPPTPSRLLDRNGKLISTFLKDNRIMVDLKELPPYLPEAFIAIEDNHFYDHNGIDIQGIARAALKNFASVGIKQGGSTITQQVVKVILTNRSRTYTRKIREAFLSLYMDFVFSKDQIMNLYLNEIYFGHGNYGVEAASNFYFQKSARELTVGESAILATLPSAPNLYSPVRNPHLSRSRVVQVLLKMVDMNYITSKKASEVYNELNDYYLNLNMSPDATAFGNRIDRAPYFTEYMRTVLENKLGKKKLYEDGLTIYTSLDLNHQDAAQKSLWKGLDEQAQKGYQNVFTHQLDFSTEYADTVSVAQDLFGLPAFEVKRTRDQFKFQLEFYKSMYEDLEILNHGAGSSAGIDNLISSLRETNPYLPHITPPQGALVEIDQKTGEITAMVGGSPFSAMNQINRAVQIKRQPGSTFKPILYATAINMKKITAASVFPDLPMIHPDTEGDYWIPENSTGGFRGFVTIREGLVNSINMISIAIAREINLKNAIEFIAKQLHVDKKEIPVNLTVALGSYEVSPLQMARAFAVFPRGGKDIEPYVINRIIDGDGKLIYQHRSGNETEIIEPGTAAIMTSLLQEVIEKGTGRSVRRVGYKGFAAGKTGTTSHFRDAWFVGFNDRYTSAVWVGYDRATQSLGEGQFGGSVAAPIWGNFQFYTQPFRSKEQPYLIEDGFVEVEICKETGKLPGENCSETIKERFLPGTEPTESSEEKSYQKVDDTMDKSEDPKKHKLDQKKLMEDIYQ